MALSIDSADGSLTEGSDRADLYVALSSRATKEMSELRSFAEVIQPLQCTVNPCPFSAYFAP